MSKKVIQIEIDKEGVVKINAIGYQGNACMKSKTLEKIIRSIDEVDNIQKLFEEEKQKQEVVNYEELI